MKLSLINGRKQKIIILFIFVAVALLSVIIFKDYFSKDDKPAYLMEIKTEKKMYAQGEQIKFFVTNQREKPIWYLVSPERCKSDFYWIILEGLDEAWKIGYKYPKCEVSEGDNNYFEIKKLNPNESISGAWDQKLFSKISEKSSYGGPGKYKIAFYYSTEAVSRNDIEIGSDLGMENTESSEFEIGKDFYNESARIEIQKENDAKRKNDLFEIKKALGTYFEANGRKYPASTGIEKLNDRNAEIYKILSGYMDEGLLYDPNHPEYYYGYNSNGISFELSARLENSEDENCEILEEYLCIYKIDSSGKISEKKYDVKEVFTVKEPFSFLVDKLKMIDDDKKDTIIITSDIIGNYEKSILETAGIDLDESVKIKKASEILQEELGLYNLVLIGNPQSNIVIEETTKKTVLIDVVEGVDAEKNSMKMVVKFAQNPWNNEKIALILETDYSMGLNLLIRGIVEIKKNEDFDHITIKSDSGKVYALVVSSDDSGSYIEDLSEFDGKYVEIKGYERIRNSEKYPIEDSIGVVDIRILE